MGGFAFSYVEATEADLAALGSSGGTPQFDFYRIDATRVLCLTWRSFSTDTWLFVIDHSDPVTVVFGTPAHFTDEAISDHRPTLTQLTSAGDWLLITPVNNYKRLAISGTTITLGAYIGGFGSFSYSSWDGATGWNHALWEGHASGTSPGINVSVPAQGHLECLGIDYNHILVPGSLVWTDSSVHNAPRFYVLDLSTSGVQPRVVFTAADLGYYPDQQGAGQIDPGAGFWWVWDIDEVGSPTHLHLARIDTDGATITVTTVTTDTGSASALTNVASDVVGRGRLGRADDDSWWLGPVSNTTLEPFWDVTTPWIYRTTLVQIVSTAAATVDYLGEADTRPPLFSRVWPFDTGRLCNEGAVGADALLSWQITDEHLRVEHHNTFPYTADAPHFTAASVGRAGLSHGRMAVAYATAFSGVAGELYAAVYKEIGLPPDPDFDVDNSTVNVGDPINFDATFTLVETRDSYWHPVLEYRWEWDDGTPDLYSSVLTATHTYRRASAGHLTGSQNADHNDGLDPIWTGYPNFFMPVLRARNSVGWSYANGQWFIEVDALPFTPPLRQAQRDDGRAGGTPRANQSRSILTTNRARASSYI